MEVYTTPPAEDKDKDMSDSVGLMCELLNAGNEFTIEQNDKKNLLVVCRKKGRILGKSKLNHHRLILGFKPDDRGLNIDDRRLDPDVKEALMKKIQTTSFEPFEGDYVSDSEDDSIYFSTLDFAEKPETQMPKTQQAFSDLSL